MNALVLDFSENNAEAVPYPSDMDYDRIAELHEAGEIDGVVCRATLGKKLDARFDEFHAELYIARDVPVAAYGVYSPWWNAYEQAAVFIQATAGKVLGIKSVARVGDVEISRPFMSKSAYAAALKVYLEEINADTIYSSKYYWEKLVGTAADSWHKRYQKWVANYTTGSTPLLPNGWEDWLLWQFSADGNQQGAYFGTHSRDVDLNRWNADYFPPPPPPPVVGFPKAGVTTAAVNFRRYPVVTQCTWIRLLPKDAALTIVGEDDGSCGYDWWEVVASDGVEGWVAKPFVQVTG